MITGESSSDLQQEKYWGTALYGAAAKGEPEIVRFLLSATPIETAEHFGQSECLRILKDGFNNVI